MKSGLQGGPRDLALQIGLIGYKGLPVNSKKESAFPNYIRLKHAYHYACYHTTKVVYHRENMQEIINDRCLFFC